MIKIDTTSSKQFSNLTLILTIFVVFLHAFNVSSDFALTDVYYIEYFFSYRVCTIALPLFFTISGFFFFNTGEMGFLDFFIKIKQRFYSLLIPYLISSFCFFLLFLVLQSFSFFLPFFNGTLIYKLPFFDKLTILLVRPIPYQLWYLRNLFFISFITPALYFSVRMYRGLPLFIFFIFFIIFDFNDKYNLFFSIQYFFLGAYLKVFFYRYFFHFKLYNPKLVYVGILWVLSGLLLFKFDSGILFRVISKVSFFSGAFFLWNFIKMPVLFRFLEKLNLYIYPFFVFLFHEPLLTFTKKILLFVFPYNKYMLLLIYFVSSMFVIGICSLFGALLSRYFNRLYLLISGNRKVNYGKY
ncbi:acyltransferase family protein [Runella zeae]|uniref:acyltransferase family protein n=1 Tax=Runella zeae TaxID=94255 RepID=UPI0023556EB9|nr:acyltransferase family protein [Runella zeae]